MTKAYTNLSKLTFQISRAFSKSLRPKEGREGGFVKRGTGKRRKRGWGGANTTAGWLG